MKRKYIMFAFLLNLLCFIFCSGVNAETKVSCHYPINDRSLTIIYNADTGKISYNSTLPNTVVTLNLKGILFVNPDSSFKCPEKLYRVINGEGRQADMAIYETKQANSFETPVDLSKSSIPKNSNIKVCSVEGCGHTGSITVDLNKKTINGFDIQGYNAIGDLKYDDIIKDGKCRADVKAYISCAGGYCSVNREGQCKVGNVDSSDPSDIPDKPNKDNQDSDDKVDNPCETIPEPIKKYINQALNLIRWVGLAAMIFLGVLDFTKAVASDDQDALKKAWGHFIKRLIAVIILFLLPLLMELIFDLVDITAQCDLEVE